MAHAQAIRIFRTAQTPGERLKEQPPLTFQPVQPEDTLSSILVDPGTTYQEILGFGGAFTEAAAVTFYKMSPEIQTEILKAYFDVQEGHGYSMGRTHINSCDFALGNYAYTEVDGDVDLEHFSIDRDRQALIPMIKAAQKVAGRPLTLYASPWSPPAWMKTNGEMNHGGKLKPEYRDAWARYYCRYLREYAQEGIPIWGLTVQNEPEAVQIWDSCIYTAEDEREFIRDFLGPTLAREGFGHIRIIIWDHNRDRMYERAKIVLDDPEAAKYVWGTGFHWYVGDNFDNVQLVHDAYPDKHLLFTEGAVGPGSLLGSWAPSEQYAHSMINDLKHWTVGWVDWNLVLDARGGPNHVNNFCSAAIIADPETGQIHYQSIYYYLGHFSRFIRPGAKRIICAATLDVLEAVAFVNPDGQIAVVVLNRSDHDVVFALKCHGGAARTEIPRHAIQTLCFAST
jgi:glucosylceramidase